MPKNFTHYQSRWVLLFAFGLSAPLACASNTSPSPVNSLMGQAPAASGDNGGTGGGKMQTTTGGTLAVGSMCGRLQGSGGVSFGTGGAGGGSLGLGETGGGNLGSGGVSLATGGASGGNLGSGGTSVASGGASIASGGTNGSSGGASCMSGLGGLDASLGTFEILSTVRLDSDGAGGIDTYTLIRNAFGPDSIEAPDLYPNNHPGMPHIIEDTDADVGNHFVFKIHRDQDWDRDTYPTTTDRQRNEIKTYEGSTESLKARQGESFFITWKFRINDTMPVSKNFSHFFQLKGVNGDDAQPLITITGAKHTNGDSIEIRHSSATGTPDDILNTASWAAARGQWLSVSCLATFSDQGSVALTVTTMNGQVLLTTNVNNLDMWRAGDFIRPKWGIYRSLMDPTNLRPDEETVRFANFSVSKVRKCAN